jgi:hypothetical protein
MVKLYRLSIIFYSTAVWGLVSLWPLNSLAEPPTNPPDHIPSHTLNNTPSNVFVPPNRGTPSHTASGGSRGNYCPLTQDHRSLVGATTQLVALLPASQQRQSVEQRPTFFVYLPPSSARMVLFGLTDDSTDDSGNYSYQTQLAVPQTGGILQFRLPETAPSLTTGKTYRWAFALLCGERLRPDSPLAEGTVQLIQPDPATTTSSLVEQPTLERAAFYRQSGLWYDALTVLANLKQAQPNDPAIAAAWTELLESVGLGEIAAQAFLYPN